uniref:Uncharacterized protein n=1 Tax=Anguilla anguilla TaxID=7936 RepID=A0A0E9PUV5_ANGAN
MCSKCMLGTVVVHKS